MGAENLASTGIRSSDRPAHNESLYRLNYPGTLYYSFTPNILTSFGPQETIVRECCITLVLFTEDGPLRTETCRNIQCEIVI